MISLQKESLASIRIKDCWPCMTLPLPPLSSMHNLRYKYFGKLSADLAHWSLVFPCRSFSFFFLFRQIPWSARALCIHFPAWASKTHSRRCLRWGTFRDSRGHLRPTWTEQVPCWGFIGFLRKPRNISLFSHLYFLNCIILSFSLSFYLFFHCCHPPKGIPGSNQGWTPALLHHCLPVMRQLELFLILKTNGRSSSRPTTEWVLCCFSARYIEFQISLLSDVFHGLSDT